jgi:hypothetical protein
MSGMDPTPEYQPPLPHRVQRMADRMQKVTGHPPEVTHPAPGRTRLTCTSPRVQVYVEYKGRNSGWAGTTLLVDGVPRPPARSDDELIQLWNDPDGNGGTTSGELPVIPFTSGPPPRDVRRFCAALPSDQIRTGYDEATGWWLAGLDLPDGAGGLRVFFARVRGGWTVNPGRPLMVVRDGEDLSGQANGDVARAMKLLTAGTPTAPGGQQAAMTGPAAATRSNSVETRRRVVIRE